MDKPGSGKNIWKPNFSRFQDLRFIVLVISGKFDLAGRNAQINPRCGQMSTTGKEKAGAFSMGSSLSLIDQAGA